MREWWSKLRGLVRRDRLDADLREEMAAHLEMEVEDRIERGLSPPEARDQARRRFGNQTLIQESSREAWMFRSVETLLHDIRYGFRLLRRAPGFAVTAVSTIASWDCRHHRGIYPARLRAAAAAAVRRTRSPRVALRNPTLGRHSPNVDVAAKFHRLARHGRKLRIDGRADGDSVPGQCLRPH